MLLLISFPKMEAIIKSIEDLQVTVHEAQQLMNSGYIKLVDAHNAQIKGLEEYEQGQEKLEAEEIELQKFKRELLSTDKGKPVTQSATGETSLKTQDFRPQTASQPGSSRKEDQMLKEY